MQTIQILILLLDGFIKLAPWRIVTETMDRIGYGASEGLARSLGVIAAACASLCVFPTASIFGPLLLSGYFDGTISSHIHPGSPLLSHLLLGFHFGVAVWAGLWWCSRSPRIDAAA